MTWFHLPLATLLLMLGGCSASAADPVVLDHLDAGDTATPLPKAVSRALQTDALVLECPEGVVDGRSRFARDWVGVHRVDLDGDGHEEWILNGLHPCLRQQADGHAYWWIYAAGPTPDDERLLLRAWQARQLEVLPGRHAGMADLRAHLVNGRGQMLQSDLASDGERYVPAARLGR